MEISPGTVLWSDFTCCRHRVIVGHPGKAKEASMKGVFLQIRTSAFPWSKSNEAGPFVKQP